MLNFAFLEKGLGIVKNINNKYKYLEKERSF